MNTTHATFLGMTYSITTTLKKFHILRRLLVCLHGRPRQATDVLQPTGLLYRPLWTFKLWPPDAPAPTDAFRTLAAEVETYGRGIGPGILPKCRLTRYI
jgi:hypothetical protein